MGGEEESLYRSLEALGEYEMSSGESVPVILGRLLALTSEINDKLTRAIMNHDALELRVEALEKAEAVRSQGLEAKVVRSAVWAILAVVGVMILKTVGLV